MSRLFRRCYAARGATAGPRTLDTVARRIGSWIEGPQAASAGTGRPPPGARLGLPASGPGSIASFAARIGAFIVDAVLSAGVALLFFGAPKAGDPPWSTVVFAVMYVLATGVFGQSPGMVLLRIRLVRLDTGAPIGLPRAVLRTVLLCLLIPALIADRDYRGLHDRAAGSAVLRTR